MDNKETINLNTILVKYLRRWKLFLLVFILSFIPAILYLKFYPRTYRFVTSILLQDESDSGMSGIGLGGASNLMKSFGIGSSGGTVNVDDEMEILASNRILRMAILELGVNVTYTEPYSFYKMYNEAPLKLSTDSATMVNLQDEYRFTVSVSPGHITIKTQTYLSGLKETFTCASLPATIKAGQDVFTLDFDHNGANIGTFKMKIRCLPAGWMAENIGKSLLIEDVSSASNVLMLSYTDHSKQRGLDMLNTLIEKYNEDIEAYKRKEDMKILSYVDSRISEVVNALKEVEAEIEVYKTKNDLTLLEVDVALYSEIYKDLITAIIQAEEYAFQIDLLDEWVRDPENMNKPIPSVFTVDEGERGIVPQYIKAVVERDRLLKSSNEKNQTYIRLNNQVELLREGVFSMIENARKSTTKTLADLKLKEQQLMAKMKSVPEKEREYVAYMRDQEILQGIYVMMLSKKEETSLSIGKQTERARLIEPPYILKKSVGPRKLYAAIGILVLTLVVPVGYLFAKDLLVSIREEFNKG